MGNASQSYGVSPAICNHTLCYLPPVAGECALLQPEPDRLACNLPTREGWKAELILVNVDWLYIIPRWFTFSQTVTHLGIYHLIVTQSQVEPTTS